MLTDGLRATRCDKAFMNERLKFSYYCPVCGHTNTFIHGCEEKICKWCNRKIKRPRKSIYDINQEKNYKRKYLEFLKKKEGM